jgi:hypothetical protein
MTRAMQARVAFAVIGIAIWGYAVATDHDNLRLVGIALLALSLILRFLPGGSQGRRSKDDRAP